MPTPSVILIRIGGVRKTSDGRPGCEAIRQPLIFHLINIDANIDVRLRTDGTQLTRITRLHFLIIQLFDSTLFARSTVLPRVIMHHYIIIIVIR